MAVKLMTLANWSDRRICFLSCYKWVKIHYLTEKLNLWTTGRCYHFSIVQWLQLSRLIQYNKVKRIERWQVVWGRYCFGTRTMRLSFSYQLWHASMCDQPNTVKKTKNKKTAYKFGYIRESIWIIFTQSMLFSLNKSYTHNSCFSLSYKNLESSLILM